MKKSWIQIDGKLIPKDEYYGNNVRGPSTNVMPDITPFKSPITGEMITTRPQLREHNRTHGVTNSLDYGKNFEWVKNRRKEIERKQRSDDRNNRIELLKQALDRR